MKRKCSEEDEGARRTLYVHNLNNKININDLRTELYLLFTTYGEIKAINANKSARSRGQAHIAFFESQDAKMALEKLQGFQFLGKSMHIEFAKTESLRILWQE